MRVRDRGGTACRSRFSGSKASSSFRSGTQPDRQGNAVEQWVMPFTLATDRILAAIRSSGSHHVSPLERASIHKRCPSRTEKGQHSILPLLENLGFQESTWHQVEA